MADANGADVAGLVESAELAALLATAAFRVALRLCVAELLSAAFDGSILILGRAFFRGLPAMASDKLS